MASSEILDKRKGKKIKVKKVKAERQKKKLKYTKEGYTKRGAVKALHRTWFLVKWVPKIILKRNFKSKKGLLIKTPT